MNLEKLIKQLLPEISSANLLDEISKRLNAPLQKKPVRGRRILTNEEKARIIALNKSGLNYLQISHRTGRAFQTIHSFLRAKKLPIQGMEG
jgi:hypothetical protein